MLGPDKPLVGMNGVQNGLDVARLMLAGASAVEITSAVMLRGFALIERSITELQDYIESKGLCASDLIGRAAAARKTFAQMPPLEENWRNYIPMEAGGKSK